MNFLSRPHFIFLAAGFVLAAVASPLSGKVFHISPDKGVHIDIPNDWLIDPTPRNIAAWDQERNYIFYGAFSPIPRGFALKEGDPGIRNFETIIQKNKAEITSRTETVIGGRPYLVISGKVSNPPSHGMIELGDFAFCSAFTLIHNRVYSFHLLERTSHWADDGMSVDQDPVFLAILQSLRESPNSGVDDAPGMTAPAKTFEAGNARMQIPATWITGRLINDTFMFCSPDGNDIIGMIATPNSGNMRTDDPKFWDQMSQTATRDGSQIIDKQRVTIRGITWCRIRTQLSNFYGGIAYTYATATPGYIDAMIISRNDLLMDNDHFEIAQDPELQAAFDSFRILPSPGAPDSSKPQAETPVSPQVVPRILSQFSSSFVFLAGFALLFGSATALLVAFSFRKGPRKSPPTRPIDRAPPLKRKN